MLFFNDFGCSELMLRKVWQSVFFLNILVCNLLFLIYILESRNEILSFCSYSNLIDGCFAYNSFKNVSRSVFLPVHLKNISSINLRYISENLLINGNMNFHSNWSIKMFTYEGAQIVPIVQPFICK